MKYAETLCEAALESALAVTDGRGIKGRTADLQNRHEEGN